MRKISKLLKIVFLVIIVIGIIAYTGIDVSSEYDWISDKRDMIFENVFDPLVKKLLQHTSELHFDEIIDATLQRYVK